jgi:hypothetical protein
MSEHTPTPWRVEYDDNGFFFIDAPGRPSPYIAATGGEGMANAENAAFIVKAVNSHDALVDALKSCAAVCAGEVTSKSGLIDALEKARAALALAGEK